MQIEPRNILLNQIEVITPTVLSSRNTTVYILILLDQCVWSPPIFGIEILTTKELLNIFCEQAEIFLEKLSAEKSHD